MGRFAGAWICVEAGAHCFDTLEQILRVWWVPPLSTNSASAPEDRVAQLSQNLMHNIYTGKSPAYL